MNPWPHFDFRSLDAPGFGEDAVREELIAPLLHNLGYRASGDDRIERSRKLVHPFVLIGTEKRRIHIIPDYLLVRHNVALAILDAKAPNERISDGKAVEQAYSYAMHKDVRVSLYALCNGRELVLFHVSRWPALLQFPLQDLENHYEVLRGYLGTEGILQTGLQPDYLPDFGLHLRKTGFWKDDTGK